ncbi:hypothetical protein BCR42DRAFT_402457 [Absidia repens]|uniref:Senescence domain-containing protein n=1 Tax=Absidia repens TaxID=90262 RepID=A0A1X2IY56_9FUNG|nr:hypothetical protein BCR42DRAFT_402457 [Absidia repens]
MPTPKTQLGHSALQAATRVMEGSAAAASTVLSASRQTLVQVIEKKYGADAGYMAGKIIGANKSDEDDVMVYFDNHGISRKVVLQQSHSITSTDIHKTTANESSTSFVVYEDRDKENENEKINDQRQVVYDIGEQDHPREEYGKKPGKLILV